MKTILIALLICFTYMFSFNTARAELDPRVKVVATMSAYGVASGVLLGFASMAFKSNGRAIFQGASIGLWTGLFFGSYVVISHSIRQTGSHTSPVSPDESDYPDNPDSPYYDSTGEEGGDDYSFNRYWIKDEFKLSDKVLNKQELARNNLNTVYMDMVKINF